MSIALSLFAILTAQQASTSVIASWVRHGCNPSHTFVRSPITKSLSEPLQGISWRIVAASHESRRGAAADVVAESSPSETIVSLDADWLAEPSFSPRQVPFQDFPAGSLAFEAFFGVSRSADATALELPMTNGLRFDLLEPGVRTLVGVARPKFTGRFGEFQRVFGIVLLPWFSIQSMVNATKEMQVTASIPRGVKVMNLQFALPKHGIFEGEIPLKARIPNTYVVKRPFCFLITNANGVSVFEGAKI
jgi:hypothetical protein